jgi:hypothetical protein
MNSADNLRRFDKKYSVGVAMPVEIVEHPLDIERVPQKILLTQPIKNPLVPGCKAGEPKRKSLLREIFEGHEEFLGRTPD